MFSAAEVSERLGSAGNVGEPNETNCLSSAGERGKAAMVMTSVKVEALATALAIVSTADIRVLVL